MGQSFTTVRQGVMGRGVGVDLQTNAAICQRAVKGGRRLSSLILKNSRRGMARRRVTGYRRGRRDFLDLGPFLTTSFVANQPWV